MRCSEVYRQCRRWRDADRPIGDNSSRGGRVPLGVSGARRGWIVPNTRWLKTGLALDPCDLSGADLLEALGAVDGLIVAREERHASHAAALITGYLVHLARAIKSGGALRLTDGAAGGTPTRLVQQPATSEELLLSGGEQKLRSAVPTC